MPSHFMFLFPETILPLIVRKCCSRSLLGRSGFMCHVSQRLDCPLKDMVINALCVIARRWPSPLRQSGTQDTQSHPKVTNQLSGFRQSARSDAF